MNDLKRLKIHRGKIVKTDKEDEEDLGSFDALGAPDADPGAFVPEPVTFSSELASLVSPSVEDKARVSQPPPPSEDEEAKIDLSALAASQAETTAEPSAADPGSAPPAAASGVFPAGSPVASAAPFPVASGSPQASSAAPSRAVDDDLQAIMASRSFGPAALTGLLKKIGPAAARAPGWAWFVLGVSVAGVVAAALFLGGEEPEQPVATATAPSQTTPGASPAYPPPGGTSQPGSTGSQGTGEARSGSARDRYSYRAGSKYRRKGSGRRARARGEGHSSASREATTATEASSSGERSIDSLLDSALGASSSSSASKTASGAARQGGRGDSSGSGLALMPSRQEVSRAMSEVLPDVRSCAGGRTGVVTADITVRSNGLVSSVRIRGAPFARTPSGRCMERAVRSARFPHFRKSVFRVTYPFRF